MDMDRKQFIGSLFATAALPSLALDTRSEFEKCRDDILYFVDHYLVMNDRLYGKLKMSDQQREYLKRMSETKDILVCAKGRQIGASTANNVFAYWKTIFFGPNHHVFIVEPSLNMAKAVNAMYWGVSNTGFMPLPNTVHFVAPKALECLDLHDKNNTFILDEYDWWELDRQRSFAYEILYRMNYSRTLEKNEPMDHQFEYAPFIISSTPRMPLEHFVFPNLHFFLHDSRYMVLPSLTRGLKA